MISVKARVSARQLSSRRWQPRNARNFGSSRKERPAFFRRKNCSGAPKALAAMNRSSGASPSAPLGVPTRRGTTGIGWLCTSHELRDVRGGITYATDEVLGIVVSLKQSFGAYAKVSASLAHQSVRALHGSHRVEGIVGEHRTAQLLFECGNEAQISRKAHHAATVCPSAALGGAEGRR